MIQDVRFAMRMFAKSPGFTALALVTISLGIGANTAIFSIVNSVLLRPLPYEDPGRIVQIANTIPVRNGEIPFSLPKFNFLRDRAHGFRALAATTVQRVQIVGPAPAAPAEFAGARVSEDFFLVFGVKPALGRVFLPDEQRPGAAPVAVISHALWQNRFGANPSAVGQTIGVNGLSAAIVGVMPAGFDFPNVEIWVPQVDRNPLLTPAQIQNGASYLMLWARLADGVPMGQAQKEIEALNDRYNESHRGFGDVTGGVQLRVLRESLTGNVRATLLVLLGAVGFVLLIASANVANLLLARAIARRKEVAIRAALGASRPRLLLQFLTESVLLAGLGAILGLLLAWWSIRAIAPAASRMLRANGAIRLDPAVLLFTAGIAMVSGILFGLGPALHASRAGLNESLKAAGRGFSGGGRLRGAMIASEVALATILLAGAGLLMRSFLRLENVDPGFRPESLLTMRIGLPPARYPEMTRQTEFFNRVFEQASAIPGVRNAAIASALPINGRTIAYFFNIEGRPKLEPAKAPIAFLDSISPGFFDTLRIPLIAGRDFTGADNASAPLVGIVNRTMARRHWPGENPIGRHVTYSREQVTVEIVGIAADIKLAGLGDPGPYEQLYVPYRQRPFLTMWLVTRGPTSIASAARREIASIDPDQPVTNLRTMDEVISDSVAEPRLRTALIGAFAALALILAAIGIAGVVAWSVSRRTGEIGVRVALGARPADVMSLLLRESFGMIGAGQLAGIAGALALTRVLSAFLFETSPVDPVTFAAVVVSLAAVELAATLIAARRALRIDPVTALRAE